METVAGVPGFAGGMIRHLQSLRRMEKDHGWIHTLLEEAENERMHLMTFLELRRYIRYPPTAAILLSNVLSPVFARRFLIDRFLWAWIIQMY